MFCKTCGNALAENEKFCPNCGAAVVQDQVAAEVVEEPVEQTVMAEPAVTETSQVIPEFVAPTPKPKKKVLGWLIPVVAVVAAAAVAIGIFWNPIKGFYLRYFGSGEAYFTYVAEEATKKAVGNFTEAYAVSMSNSAATEAGVGASVTVNVGDKAKDMLTDLAEDSGLSGLDVSWFDSIGVNMDISAVEDMMQFGAGVKLNGTELLDAEAIVDMARGNFYVALLSLSDQYLMGEIDLADYAGMMEELPVEEILAAMPSDKEVSSVLNRYTSIAFQEMNKVEKSKEKLEIGDVEQNVVALEVKIDYKTVKNIVVAVLSEAKSDKEIKTILRKFADGADLDADMVYDSFKESVSDALEHFKDMKIEKNETLAEVTLYVNNSHDIVGFSMDVDDEEVVFCATAQDGKNFAFELTAEGLLITGEGTEQKGVVNGEYTVKYADMQICKISLIDFSTNDNLLNGKVRIAPSSDALREIDMGSMVASMISLANVQVEFGFTTQEKSSAMDINLLTGKDLLIGVTFAVETKEADTIKAPSNNTIHIGDAEDWLETINVETVLDNLEDAGVPSELVSYVRSMYEAYTSYGYPY